MTQRRRSDRWVTPAVVVTGIIVGGLVVVAVAGLVAYLTARGVDPSPVVQLATAAAATIGSLSTLALQLAGRRTAAATERNTSPLAPGGVPLKLSPTNRGPTAAAASSRAVAVTDEQTTVLPAVPPAVPARQPRGAHRWPDEWEGRGNGSGPGVR